MILFIFEKFEFLRFLQRSKFKVQKCSELRLKKKIPKNIYAPAIWNPQTPSRILLLIYYLSLKYQQLHILVVFRDQVIKAMNRTYLSVQYHWNMPTFRDQTLKIICYDSLLWSIAKRNFAKHFNLRCFASMIAEWFDSIITMRRKNANRWPWSDRPAYSPDWDAKTVIPGAFSA